MRVRHVLGLSAVVVLSSFVVACGGSDETGSSSGSSGSSGTTSSSGGSSGSSGTTSSSGGSSGSSGTTSSSSGTSGTTTTKKEFGAQCKQSADCKSDFCVFKSGGSIGMCTQTCDDDIDCPGLDNTCVRLGDAPQKACVPK